MEIHQHHIAQSPTHSHHRYTNSEYYTQPYNSLSADSQQFDFQQHHNSLLIDPNPHQQPIKSEHIKLEVYGSPVDNVGTSPTGLQTSPPKMLSNASPPSTSSPPVNSFVDQQEKLSAFAFLQPVDGDSSASLNLNYGFGTSSIGLDSVSTPTKGNSASKHDRKRPYPCITCSSRFGSKMELEEHQNSHTGQKPFECDICQSRFNRRSTLWNHKRIHSDAKPFSCTVCQMTFKWKNSLKCHKEMHMRKNEVSSVVDDIKLLTYATAAKKKMAENSVNGLPPTAAIQTVASRKKPASKKKVKRELQEHIVSSTMSANTAVATSIPFSLFGNMDPSLSGRGLLGDQQLDTGVAPSHQHLAITHTSAQQHQQFDLSQINQNNLLMQAIYSGSGTSNTNTASNNSAGHPQTQLTDEAFELINGSHSAHAGSLGLDLLPTAPNGQPFLLGAEPKFNNDIASAVMQSTTNMRLPTNFPMNILDFQQQLTGTNQPQQQQLSYIQTQQQQAQPSPNNLANTLHQQQNSANNAMLNYPQRAELLLDDMLNYQQTALDPSLLLNTQQSAHPNHQQQAQQQSHMDQYADFMLNGNPVYSLSASQQQQADNAMAGSLHMQQLQQQQQMTLNHNMSFVGQQNAALNTNFPSFMDDMQITQEELQNLAQMLPYDKSKW